MDDRARNDPSIDRRRFLQLSGYGGVVFASGLGLTACASGPGRAAPDFFFVQLSDTHWGYHGAANPDDQGTLPKAIAAVNALPRDPDFVVFTGDLTHLTLDGKLRRERLAQFRDQIAELRVRDIRLLPGEHDASVDHGEAFREFFGPSHYSFDHKGIHFVALDNVSDPAGSIGAEQLAWLQKDLAALPRDAPIIVLTHRPLFGLQPQWGWATRDGAQALEILQPFSRVTVFYGHIHQEHHHRTGNVVHHAAASLIFPLPAPGSGTDHLPLPWDPARPYRGLAWREVLLDGGDPSPRAQEHPLA
jgi:3',5'-cyclic AMP phosphodiesterase CpdA